MTHSSFTTIQKDAQRDVTPSHKQKTPNSDSSADLHEMFVTQTSPIKNHYSQEQVEVKVKDIFDEVLSQTPHQSQQHETQPQQVKQNETQPQQLIQQKETPKRAIDLCFDYIDSFLQTHPVNINYSRYFHLPYSKN